MHRLILACLLLLVVSACAPKQSYTNNAGENSVTVQAVQQMNEATSVYRELITGTDSQIPQALLGQARCVAVLPNVLKGALFAGGKYGKGIASCRNTAGVWSAPSFLTLSAVSVGFQFGAEQADIVLFLTGENAQDTLLKNKITLGGDVSIAAGPVGRRASGSTDFSKNAIYSYARTKGLFAGVSLEGAVLQSDEVGVEAFYGLNYPIRDLLLGRTDIPAPPEAKAFLAELPAPKGRQRS